MKRFTQWTVLAISLSTAAGSFYYISNSLQDGAQSIAMDRGPGGGPKGHRNGGRPGEAPPGAKGAQHPSTKERKESTLVLSVINAMASSYSPTITATGLIVPRYSLTLTSKVSGEVSQISKYLEPGLRVKKGDKLIQLINKELNTAVANAQKDLASAELELKEEERQGAQAKAEWIAAGFKGEPDSELVLRKPQLANASAAVAVAAAKATLSEAKDNLKQTNITSPFDALIVSQQATPGSNIGTSDEIATLFSTDRADVTLNLSLSDWKKLPDFNTLMSTQWPAQISSIDSNTTWQGKVVSANQHIDTTTRMRSLTVGLDSPLDREQPLLPGSFVSVSLSGKTIDGLWKLPNTALSQQSEVWYLDEESRLDAFETTPLFSDSHYTYIQVPERFSDKTYRVLVKPYSSYLKGTLATPAEDSN